MIDIGSIGSLSVPMVLLVVLVTIGASFLSGLASKLGWLDASLREAELLERLERVEGMDAEAEWLRGSIRRRVSKAEARYGLTASLGEALKARAPDYIHTTVISCIVMSVAFAYIGHAHAVPSACLCAAFVGVLIHGVPAVYGVVKNGGRHMPKSRAMAISRASIARRNLDTKESMSASMRMSHVGERPERDTEGSEHHREAEVGQDEDDAVDDDSHREILP